MFRLLLVDDDPDILAQYETALACVGYDLVMANSTKETRQKLKTARPDLAIVDVMMENGIPGFDLAREIHHEYPKIPILMISALNQELNAPMKIEPDEKLPIFKFLDKPISSLTLRVEIENALRSTGSA